MPFPDVATGFETLFEPTRIWLFGKPFPTIAYVPDTMTGKTGPGTGPDSTPPRANEFMDYKAPAQGSQLPMPPRRIERKLRREDQVFARIYSFSFEGHYYKLPRPLLFLVSSRPDKAADYARGGSGPSAFFTKFVGVEARDWQFGDDVLVWQVDKRDVAVCLDIEVGPYQEILLDSMIAYEEDVESRRSGGSRGSFASRGSMSFRGSMVGPHQNR